MATDLNFISDCKEALNKQGMEKYLAIVFGNEVAHPNDLIHYNTYPFLFWRRGE